MQDEIKMLRNRMIFFYYKQAIQLGLNKFKLPDILSDLQKVDEKIPFAVISAIFSYDI